MPDPITTYFDYTRDKDLLEKGNQKTVETDTAWAADIEQDVIDYYTRHLLDSVLIVNDLMAEGPYITWQQQASSVSIGNDLYVFLRGYAVDPADANPLLARTLKRAIIRVIEWRLEQRKINPHEMNRAANTETGTSVAFREDSRQSFPPEWDRELRQFSTLDTAIDAVIGW